MDWIHKQATQQWLQCSLEANHRWKEAFWPNGRTNMSECPLCRWKEGPEQVEVYLWLINNGYDRLLLRYHPEDLPKEKGKRLSYFANMLVDPSKQLWVLIDFDVKGVWISYDGREEKLQHQQSKTVIKTYYAITHNLPIVRIKQGSQNTLPLLKQALEKINKGSKLEICNSFDNDYDWLFQRIIRTTASGVKEGDVKYHVYTPRPILINSYKRWASKHSKSLHYDAVMTDNIKGLQTWDEYKPSRSFESRSFESRSFAKHVVPSLDQRDGSNAIVCDISDNVETETPW